MARGTERAARFDMRASRFVELLLLVVASSTSACAVETTDEGTSSSAASSALTSPAPPPPCDTAPYEPAPIRENVSYLLVRAPETGQFFDRLALWSWSSRFDALVGARVVAGRYELENPECAGDSPTLVLLLDDGPMMRFAVAPATNGDLAFVPSGLTQSFAAFTMRVAE